MPHYTLENYWGWIGREVEDESESGLCFPGKEFQKDPLIRELHIFWGNALIYKCANRKKRDKHQRKG